MIQEGEKFPALDEVCRLFSFGVVGRRQDSALKHCGELAERLLELDRARKILIEALGFFHAFDVGAKRFGKKDCGEHLHSLFL